MRVEFSIQPRACEAPFSFDGARRSLQHMCDLFDTQACEEPQLDDARLIGIVCCQCGDGFVNREHVRCAG